MKKLLNYEQKILLILGIAFLLIVYAIPTYIILKSDNELTVPEQTESSMALEPTIITEEIVVENYIVQEHIVEVTIEATDVELIAKTIWGEARGLSTLEQSAVIWCILNRVDAGYGTIVDVITAPNQFVGYSSSNPVTDEFAALAEDVLTRWQMEKLCIGDIGRTLPSDYLWFTGDNQHNYFRNAFSGNYDTWNWDCWNPYP